VAFVNGLQHRNVNGRSNSGDDSSTASTNLVSFYPEISEFMASGK